jgi:hypothetical protein
MIFDMTQSQPQQGEVQGSGEFRSLSQVTFGQVEAALRDVPVDLLPEVYEYLLTLRFSAPHTPNARTRQVFEDTDAGRELQEDQTVDEFFTRIDTSES